MKKRQQRNTIECAIRRQNPLYHEGEQQRNILMHSQRRQNPEVHVSERLRNTRQTKERRNVQRSEQQIDQYILEENIIDVTVPIELGPMRYRPKGAEKKKQLFSGKTGEVSRRNEQRFLRYNETLSKDQQGYVHAAEVCGSWLVCGFLTK